MRRTQGLAHQVLVLELDLEQVLSLVRLLGCSLRLSVGLRAPSDVILELVERHEHLIMVIELLVVLLVEVVFLLEGRLLTAPSLALIEDLELRLQLVFVYQLRVAKLLGDAAHALGRGRGHN